MGMKNLNLKFLFKTTRCASQRLELLKPEGAKGLDLNEEVIPRNFQVNSIIVY